MRILFLVLVAGYLVFGTLGSAMATTVVPMDLNDLVGLSSDVVVGKVTAKTADWDPSGSCIVTDYSISVERSLKTTSSGTMNFRAYGGQVGDTVIRVDGVPEFEIGDLIVLFLDQRHSELFPVTGMFQGVFRLSEAPGAKERAVFTHDWRPVNGIDSGVLVIESVPQDLSGPVETSPLDETDTAQRKNEAAFRSGSCMRLGSFLQEIQAIIEAQRVRGYDGPYKDMFVNEKVPTSPEPGSGRVSGHTTDPALPEPISNTEPVEPEND